VALGTDSGRCGEEGEGGSYRKKERRQGLGGGRRPILNNKKRIGRTLRRRENSNQRNLPQGTAVDAKKEQDHFNPEKRKESRNLMRRRPQHNRLEWRGERKSLCF